MTAPRGGLVVVVLAADEEPERRVVPIDNIRCLAKMLATSLSVPVETPTKVRGGEGGRTTELAMCCRSHPRPSGVYSSRKNPWCLTPQTASAGSERR